MKATNLIRHALKTLDQGLITEYVFLRRVQEIALREIDESEMQAFREKELEDSTVDFISLFMPDLGLDVIEQLKKAVFALRAHGWCVTHSEDGTIIARSPKWDWETHQTTTSKDPRFLLDLHKKLDTF